MYRTHFKHVATQWNSELWLLASKPMVNEFEGSHIIYKELRAKKLWKVYTQPYMWEAHPHMHWTHLNHVASQRNSELRLLASKPRWWVNKFDAVHVKSSSQMMCIGRVKKLWKMYTQPFMWKAHHRTHLNHVPLKRNSEQSLRLHSKTCTNVADTGSASGATFQCMHIYIFLYVSYLGRTSLAGLQRSEDRATLLLLVQVI